MSAIPNPPQRDTFAVVPVVDYEPPPRDIRHCRPPSPKASRRRNTHVPQEHSGRHTTVARRSDIPASMRQAASFADAALRRVLEVIDRRRPVAQLRGLLAAGLADSVLSANRFTACHDSVAMLRRLRLQAVGEQDRFPAAELLGTYRRGRRIHAVACRIEQVAGSRWQVVALHIG